MNREEFPHQFFCSNFFSLKRYIFYTVLIHMCTFKRYFTSNAWRK